MRLTKSKILGLATPARLGGLIRHRQAYRPTTKNKKDRGPKHMKTPAKLPLFASSSTGAYVLPPVADARPALARLRDTAALGSCPSLEFLDGTSGRRNKGGIERVAITHKMAYREL
jgi:hypothetical protein